MRVRAVLVALGLFLMAPAALAAEPGYSSLPMERAIPLMSQSKPPLILDVREPYEFAAGHVPGARNVPLGQVGAWAQGQDKQQPILVICQSGRRSLRASSDLARQGFTRVTNVEGGFRAWQDRGLPVATP